MPEDIAAGGTGFGGGRGCCQGLPDGWNQRRDLLHVAQEVWRDAKPQLTELKALGNENQRLKKIVVDLELDKLILKESLDFLEPKI